METKIKKLTGKNINKFIELIKVFGEVFEIQNFSIPSRKYLQKLLSKTGFDVFIAEKENKIFGGLTAYTLDQYYSERPLAYIYDLAVKKQFQRQGIGRKLINAAAEYYSSKGYEELFVQADKVDDYAVEFYRKTPIAGADETIQFYYKLKNK